VRSLSLAHLRAADLIERILVAATILMGDAGPQRVRATITTARITIANQTTHVALALVMTRKVQGGLYRTLVGMSRNKAQRVELLDGTVSSGGTTIQFGPDTAAAARNIEWLTDGDGVNLPWPGPGGPWFIRLDLAKVDGRAQVVGLHLQSYVDGVDESGQPLRAAGPHGLTEVTHAVVRAIKMGQVAESGRHLLSLMQTAKMFIETSELTVKEGIARQLLELTKRGTPRRRRPPADEDFLAHIAQLYCEALATGGEPRRKPAKYVEGKLRQGGLQIDGPAVRKLVARARSQGLLAPTTPRQPG